jgi:hypothetical protein
MRIQYSLDAVEDSTRLEGRNEFKVLEKTLDFFLKDLSSIATIF